MSRAEPGPIKIALAVVAFFAALPVALPIAAVQQLNLERRRKKYASTFACVVCKKILGKAALERADACWQEYMHSFFERGVRPRVIRTYRALCECGQKYDFNEKSSQFELIADNNG